MRVSQLVSDLSSETLASLYNASALHKWPPVLTNKLVTPHKLCTQESSRGGNNGRESSQQPALLLSSGHEGKARKTSS